MNNLHIHEGCDGWVIMDHDGNEDDAPVGSYPTKAAAEEAYNEILRIEADVAAVEPVKPELRAIDCTTTKQWEQWARERREYDDPCGQNRSRY